MFKTPSFPTPRSALAASAAAGVVIAVVLAVLGGRAVSAQDKYAVQVPNGLAFSEFRGFEDWPTVAVSQTGNLIEVILANPLMIEAYRAGAPGNGLSSTAPRWRRSIGTRKRVRRPPNRPLCRTPCMTLISW